MNQHSEPIRVRRAYHLLRHLAKNDLRAWPTPAVQLMFHAVLELGVVLSDELDRRRCP